MFSIGMSSIAFLPELPPLSVDRAFTRFQALSSEVFHVPAEGLGHCTEGKGLSGSPCAALCVPLEEQERVPSAFEPREHLR